MKKLNITILMVLGALLAVSCDSDRDSNPDLQIPTSFVLNEPAYASTGVYDLKNTETIELTTTQPDYGFTAATTYQVQISTTGQFNDESGETPATYATLATASTSAKIEADATEMAVAIVGLLGVTEEADFPKDPFKLYVRLKASLTGGKAPVYSNVIELPKVLGYFALDAMTMPKDIYIIGSINEWDWAKSYSMVPVHSNDGKFWRVIYCEAGAEIKFNTAKSWDGNEFGYEEDRFPTESVNYAGIEDGGGNIKINNAGWYIVVVTTGIQGRSYTYTVEFLPPNVYLTGDATGGWEVFDETTIFTVPADGSGEFVSPAAKADAELRMCIKLPDIDWWKTEFVILDGIIEYRGGGDDQERTNISAGQKAYLKFLTNEGSVK